MRFVSDGREPVGGRDVRVRFCEAGGKHFCHDVAAFANAGGDGFARCFCVGENGESRRHCRNDAAADDSCAADADDGGKAAFPVGTVTTTTPTAAGTTKAAAATFRACGATVGNTTWRYYLYIPPEPRTGMPLIVYLHGGSGKGNDLNLITAADGFPK